MTQQDFINDLEKIMEESIAIVKNKNTDYAVETDPFRNFRFADYLGSDVKRAILLRIGDKMSRISNLLDRPAAVVDEKVEDTIKDAINYFAILLAYLRSEEKRANVKK